MPQTAISVPVSNFELRRRFFFLSQTVSFFTSDHIISHPKGVLLGGSLRHQFVTGGFLLLQTAIAAIAGVGEASIRDTGTAFCRTSPPKNK